MRLCAVWCWIFPALSLHKSKWNRRSGRYRQKESQRIWWIIQAGLQQLTVRPKTLRCVSARCHTESTNLLWRATVCAASRSKLISTTSVTASCLIFMVEENVWERREIGVKNCKEGSGKKKKKKILSDALTLRRERESVKCALKGKREGPKTQILWEGIVEYADKKLLKLLEVTDLQIWWSPLGYEGDPLFKI